MAWRIVRQPSGKFARFSDVVDAFTDYDMTRKEAVEVCVSHGCDNSVAQNKVLAAVVDMLRSGMRGDGLARWRESLATVRTIHGEAAAKKCRKWGGVKRRV